MTPDALEYAKLTEDDLCFELKRLRQRCEVLERDKRILEEEINIATQRNNDKDKLAAYEANIAAQSKQLKSLRSLVTMQKQKFRVVKAHLSLERRALSDILVELHGGLTDIRLDTDNALAVYNDKIRVLFSEQKTKDEHNANSIAAAKEYIKQLEIEAAHRGKELAQLKHDLHSAQQTANHEQSSLKEQISSISAKVQKYQEEHAKEVCKLYADIENRHREQQDLSSTNAALTAEVANVTQQLTRAKKDLCDAVASSSATITSLTAEIAQLKQQLSDATKDNQALHNKLISVTDAQTAKNGQQEQILQLHDKLVKDFHVVLEREKRLQAELAERNNDKNDISSRLRSIQEKVASMETDHAAEVEALQKQLSAEQQRTKTLSSDVTALNDSMIHVKQHTEEWKQKCNAKENEIISLQQQLQQQTTSVTSLRSSNQQLQLQVDGLQKVMLAHETLENENSALRKRIDQLTTQLSDANNTISEYNDKLKQHDPSALTTATMRISSLEQLLQSKDENIDHLKETIRRECEERTEMMIEISELKERIKRLKTKSTADSTTTTVPTASNAIDNTTKFPSLKNIVPESTPETISKKGMLEDSEDAKWSQKVNMYSSKNKNKVKR